MLCRLCLLDCDDLIEIFDDEGERLRIRSTVAQHFGLQLQTDDEISDKICTTCWIEIDNFHTFYLDVKRAQEKLDIELAKNIDPDPDTDEDICDDNEFDTDEDDFDDDPTIFPSNNNCDRNYLGTFWRDTSNIAGDIDVFAAPSRTASKMALGRKVEKYSNYADSENNNIIVLDIGSSKNNNNDIDFLTGYENGRSRKQRDDNLRSRFKRLGIPGLNKVIDRNELSITALPSTADSGGGINESEDDICKYIKLNCELCSKQFKIFSDLKHHFRIAHKIAGYVVCCNEKLFKPVHLVNHVMKHLDRSRFEYEQKWHSFG